MRSILAFLVASLVVLATACTSPTAPSRFAAARCQDGTNNCPPTLMLACDPTASEGHGGCNPTH